MSTPAVLLLVLLHIPFAIAINIRTSYGTLGGTDLTASDGTVVHVFKKIPQAQPPIGEFRYRLPKPPESWEGVLNATEYSAACMSKSSVAVAVQRFLSEDCLYLNVFLPSQCLSWNTLCSVIIYLHGGKLSYDSAVMFNDSFIIEHYSTKGIVFVIPSMRLGSFGLLAIKDTSIVPRNLPIFDVLLGLNWVNNEISAFGGDNTKVTLMGHSIGGSIAFMLALSRNIDPGRKLFQKVISMSGDVFFATEQKMLEVTKRFLEEVQCTRDSDEESFECVRQLDGKFLLEKQREIEDEGFFFDSVAFAPPIADPNENFLEMIKEAPVRDILCGSTFMEFGALEDGDGVEIGRFIGLRNEEKVSAKYFSDRHNPSSEVSKFPSYLSQVVFVGNFRYGSSQEEKGANVWIYEFDQPPIPFHASDMKYFIGAHPKPFVTEDDVIIGHLYVTFISNFVKGSSEPLPGKGFN